MSIYDDCAGGDILTLRRREKRMMTFLTWIMIKKTESEKYQDYACVGGVRIIRARSRSCEYSFGNRVPACV